VVCKLEEEHKDDIAKVVCDAVHLQAPEIPTGLCQTVAAFGLNLKIEALCPHQAFTSLPFDNRTLRSPPFDKIIDQINKIIDGMKDVVCKLEEEHKDDIAKVVCDAVHLQVPEIPAGLCQTVAAFGLNLKIEALCPHQALGSLPFDNRTLGALPFDKIIDQINKIIDGMKDVVCKLEEEHKDDIAKVVCDAVHEQAPEIPTGLCESVAVFGLNVKIEALCPHQKLRSLPFDKIIDQINKIIDGMKDVVCKLEEEHKDDIAKVVCDAVHQQAPEIPAGLCETVAVFGLNLKIEVLCPHQTLRSRPSGSLPLGNIIDQISKIIDGMKDVVCKLEEEHKDDIAKVVCDAVHLQAPEIPTGLCQTVAAFGLNLKIEALCPHQTLTSLPFEVSV